MSNAALDFLRQKTSIPSELVTADWALVPSGVRERSFFMAAVDDAEILDRFRRESEAVVAGEKSESEAMVAIGDFLKAYDYAPEPGQEGTIKDLSSLRRIRIALRTNVDAARSYGQWVRQQAALKAFPATRFLRGRQAKEPRDWPSAWRAALAAEGAIGATAGDSEDNLVALANHGLWTNPEFNQLGSPWTPFAFGSGMITQPVSRAEAKALGLLPDPKADPESAETIHWRSMLEPQDRSFNETLQTSPAVESPEIREGLAKRLKGFARWEPSETKNQEPGTQNNPTLIFTDPNGTRQATASELLQIWAEGLPNDPETGDPWPLLQRDALKAYALDGRNYRGDSNARADLQRLLRRLLPDPADPTDSPDPADPLIAAAIKLVARLRKARYALPLAETLPAFIAALARLLGVL